MNSANTKGAAVAGLVGHFCSVRRNGVHCSKVGVAGVGGSSLEHSLKVMLRSARLFAKAVGRGVHCNGLSTASRRMCRTTELTRTSRFVGVLPGKCSAVLDKSNRRLSRKRHRLLSVTETTMTGPPMLVLSRTASDVSAHARDVMRGNVSGLVGNHAMFIVTRQLSAVEGDSTVVMLSRKGVVRENSRRSLVGLGKACCRLCANGLRLSWKAVEGATVVSRRRWL